MRTSITAADIITASYLLSLLFLSGCDTTNGDQHYERIGEVTFRRSFAGHENWTPSELDSVQRSNPTTTTDPGASGSPAFDVLRSMGLTSGEALLLDSTGQDLRDTIMVPNHGSGMDTVYIEKDTITWQMAIRINSGSTTDRIPIEKVSSSFVAYLVPSRRGDQPFIAVLQQYYIMNGDNFEVAVYGKQDARYGEK